MGFGKRYLANIIILLATIAFLPATLIAATSSYGLGPVVSTKQNATGLSFSYRHSSQNGYQVQASFMDAKSVSIEMDRLRFFRPRLLSRLGFEVFSGLGLYGEAKGHSEYQESYRVVVPMGLSFQWTKMPVSFYASQSAMIGPLPLTEIYGRFQFGLRALF